MRNLLTATVVAAALALTACGGTDGPSTFAQDGYPFTFEYPADFTASDDVSFDSELGAKADDTTAVGLDNSNGIVLQRYTLNIEVTADNLDRAQAEFDQLVSQIDPTASGSAGETAGFPSLSYDAVAVPAPPEGESRLTLLFDGDQEFVLNCQSTPDERDVIDAACDQALETVAAS